MIRKEEIDAKSGELGVHVSHVQRDYVFGWLLSALYRDDNPLQRMLVLKGGNCFRKVYFENARYSNDLDFGVQSDIDPTLLLASLKQACTVAGSQSGIEFLVEDSRVSEQKGADSDARTFDARVYFRSFYSDNEDLRLRVSMDVREYERILLPVQSRPLIHSYSDAELCQGHIRCVKLEELLASKLKALLQRRHSPDLYDFVHSLLFQKSLAVSRREVVSTFLRQTIYEPNPAIARGLLLDLPFQILRGFWNEYLVCPRPALITFEQAEQWFRTLITEMFGAQGVRATADLNYFPSSLRDVIQEGGRLQRVLRLVYDGLERRVEPYALSYKRRKDGLAREYFYAWDLTGGRSGQVGIKSYTADSVQSIALTDDSFDPRFPVELAKAGEYFSRPYFSGGAGRSGGQHRRATYAAAGDLTVECIVCGRRFARTRYETRLAAHNDRHGNRCMGRVGTIV